MADSDTTPQNETAVPPPPTGDGEKAGGRDQVTGQFVRGNRCGRGSPLAAAAQKLRSAMFKAIKIGDIRRVIAAMVEKAAGGDVPAAALILRYCLGEPVAMDTLAQIEELELAVARLTEGGTS